MDMVLGRIGFESFFKTDGVTSGVKTASESIESLSKPVDSVTTRLGAMTTRVEDAAGGLARLAVKAAPGVLLAFGAAVSVAAKSAVSFSGELMDLNYQTDLSLHMLQRMEFGGKQVDLSLTEAAKAVTTMQTGIVNASPKVLTALNALNVPLEEARALESDALFLRVATSLDEIESPALRAATAAKLFGTELGAKMLPLLEDFNTLTGEIPALSDRAVEGLDAMSKGWAKISTTFTSDFRARVGESISELMRISEFRGAGDILGDQVAGSIKNTTGALEAMLPKVTSLSPPLLSAADALKEYDARYGESDKAMRAGIAVWERQTSIVQDLADELTGRNLATEVDLIGRAIQTAGGMAKITTHEAGNLATELSRLHKQGAALPPELDDFRRAMERVRFAEELGIGTNKMFVETLQRTNVNLGIARDTAQMTAQMFDNKLTPSWYSLLSVSKDFAATVTTLPSPSPQHFEPWRAGVLTTFEGFTQDLAGVMHAMVDGWHGAWSAMKQMGMNVFHSLLQAAIDQFLNPLMSAWTQALTQMASAKMGGSALNTGAGAASAGSGMTSGGIGLGGVAGAALTIGSTYAIFDALLPGDTGLIEGVFSRKYTSPEAQAQIDAQKFRDDAAYMGMSVEEAIAQGWASSLNQDAQRALGIPFSQGGWGEFGDGTPAVLHGNEAVFPLPTGFDLAATLRSIAGGGSGGSGGVGGAANLEALAAMERRFHDGLLQMRMLMPIAIRDAVAAARR